MSLTTVSGLLILGSALASVSMVGRWMGAVAVGEYLLIRRISNWLVSGAQLGLGVALPRYVAQAVDRQKTDLLGYVLASLVSLLAVACGLALLLVWQGPLFAHWLFGDSSLSRLILPLGVLLIGQAAHTGVFGYYRGRLEMHWANGLQIINVVLVPVAAIFFLYRGHDVAAIVLATGLATLLGSALFLVPAAFELFPGKVPGLRPYFAELLRYGMARVPGDFAIAALAAAGPVFASHYLPLSEVSQLLLGLGILVAISVSVKPCSTVLLSKISMMMARGRTDQVRTSLDQFISGIVELSIFACIQCIVFTPLLVRLWVGPSYLGGARVIQITLLSVPFYLFFVALRSAIDAASVTAHNAHSSYLALVVLLLLSSLSLWLAPRARLLEAIAAACAASYAVLAWRTEVASRQLFGLQVPWRRCILPITAALLLGGVSYLVEAWFGAKQGLLSLLVVEAVLLPVFVVLSRLAGSTWWSYFWRLLVTRNDEGKAMEMTSSVA